MRRFAQVVVRLLTTATLAVSSGCAVQPPATQAAPVTISISGRVHGGQQPVSGATIWMYGIFGLGSTSQGMGSTVTTDSYGNFSLTGRYTCPFPSTEVYVVALGGDPGVGQNNPAIGMMAALGPCGNLTPSTYIWISEATTVASIEALSTYMDAYNVMSPSFGDSTQFTNAFARVNQYVNIASGTAPGPDLPAGYTASTALLNTLSNILSSCIDSTGGVAGDGSPCGQLFSLSTTRRPSDGSLVIPTDTLTAMLTIAHNPTSNVTGLYNLAPAIAPFQPTLTAPPADFTLRIQPN
jgi:hypothetical protein